MAIMFCMQLTNADETVPEHLQSRFLVWESNILNLTLPGTTLNRYFYQPYEHFLRNRNKTDMYYFEISKLYIVFKKG